MKEVIEKIIQSNMTSFLITVFGIYFTIAGAIYLANLFEIIPVLAIQDLCKGLSEYEIKGITQYKLWDSYLFFDVFVPDVIHDINISQCSGK